MSIFSTILTIAVIVLAIHFIKTNKSQPKEKYNYVVWFDRTSDAVDGVLNFLYKLQSDKDLCSFIESQKGATLRINGKTITSSHEKLKHLFLMDVAKCYATMDYSPAGSDRRSIPMFLFYSRLSDPSVSITIDTLPTYKEKCQDSFDRIMGQLSNSVKKSTDIYFVAEYLKHYNKELLSEYVKTLLKFGYAVAGAKGKVSKKDDQALDRIFNYLGEI